MKEQSEQNVCPGCNSFVSPQRVRKHIESCREYPSTVYKQVCRLQARTPLNVLRFLECEMEMARDKVTALVKQRVGASEPKSQKMEDEQDIDKLLKVINQSSYVIESEPDMSIYDSYLVACQLCERKFYRNIDNHMIFDVFDCWHTFCLPCLNKYIDVEFVNQGGQLKCPGKKCTKVMEQQQIKGLIGKEKLDQLQIKIMMKMYNIISCFKCNQQYQFQEGNPRDAPKKDGNGKDLRPQHARDYAVNRFVCNTPSCKVEQCKTCKASPYHLGMTCKEYKDHSLLKKCRYCEQPLTEKTASLSKVKAHADICNAKDCQDAMKVACDKCNPCGHPCYGFKGETSCLPCLDEKCAPKSPELHGVNGSQYCAVCYIEALSASPCVRSTCGHIFHVKCLKKRFQIRWLTPRIFFNFCLCPLCKKWISVPPQSELYKPSTQNLQLFEKIQNMALQRLKFEELEKNDPKLKDKTSPYFGKQKEYAMLIYAYFQCFKCKKPYFGGRKDCVAAMNEANNAAGVFKPQQLICANCCQVPIQNCPKHGKDFIEFKCKFCCSIAQWFCWGNTHFCQPCHKKQCSGEYVSKYTKQQLPKCQGPDKCPVGGNHNGNGEEKMLGCAICRNIRDNARSF